ncbi:MAG: hypothetical protein ACYDEP_02870 [Acidimicrobiales bacterium]
MPRYEITVQGKLSGVENDLAPEEIESVVDGVVAQLEALNAEDIDVSTNLQDSIVVVSVTKEADSLPIAQEIGNGIIRTAFHAAEVATPGWLINWVMAKTLPEQDNHPNLVAS